MKKRIISLCMAISLSIAMLPQIASNVNAATIESGSCGDFATWTLSNEGTLTISGSGEMPDYSSTSGKGAPWESVRDQVNKVIIEDGITYIGRASFYKCANLTDVSVPNSVAKFGASVFLGCDNLASFVFPQGLKEVRASMFEYCDKLDNIVLPDGVETIDYRAFGYCTNLTNIVIPNSVTTIDSYAFSGCESLKDVYYAGTEQQWDIISIGDMNNDLRNATIHFQSTESIQEDGFPYVYTVKEIEQMVAKYYNDNMSDDEYPGEGTYVVFSSETYINYNMCSVVVRFQGTNATAANIFIADVTIDMSTGEMFIWDVSQGFLWEQVGPNIDNSNVIANSYSEMLSQGTYVQYVQENAYNYEYTIENGEMVYNFALVDIDQDGIHELVVDAMDILGWFADLVFTKTDDGSVIFCGSLWTYSPVEYSAEHSALSYITARPAFGEVPYAYINLSEAGIIDYSVEKHDDTFQQLDWMTLDDILPIADFVPAESSTSAYEEYARSEWIEQHMEYAASDEYQKEIVRGFTGSLNDLFADIKNDDVIRSYSTLDSINQILSFDLDLSETQEYELLLGQIFFSYVGEDAIEEIYAENMTKAVIMLGEIILMLDDFKQIGDSEQLKGILNALKSSKGVDAMNAACDRFFNFVDGYDNIDIKEHLTGSIKKESFNFAWDVTIDSLDLVTTTLKELTMYIAAGEAYSQTSDAFGEVLLGMRRKINVPSDNSVFEPIITKDLMTNELIWNLTTPNDSPFPDPLNTPVVLKDLANAIENFYTSIETYKNESSDYIAQKAIEDLKDGAVNDVLINNGENAALSLSSCLPIVREYKIIKDILSTGQSLIDLMTSIDDQEYLGTMFIRLYCISYLHYLAVDNLAGDPQSWESVPWGYNSTPGMILETNENQDLYEYQFERATSFDEAVNVYKSISIVAAEYALKYSNIFLGEALAELNEYDNGGFREQFLKNRDKLVEAVNDYKNTVVKLESQRTEIQAISCHDSDLQYDSVNDEIIYNFKDSRIYVVACPVDVIVKNESGEQIAYLSGEENEILDGYEFYFRTIKIQDDSGEYIKVAIVPNHYQIEMKGTDNGVMNAFVADFTTGDVGEVETYFNIPVEKDSVGYFEVSAEATDQSSLVMDQVAYTNMESEADLPTNWGNFNTWIWVAGGAVVFAVILIVIFSIKKKSRK